MQVTLLKAKLHWVCVTHTDAEREGAFTIDGNLLDLAGIHEFEQVQVYNVGNGERLTSYVMRAEHGSRIVSVNGAAARKARVGDRLIICAFAGLSRKEMIGFKPTSIYCDEENHVTGATNVVPMQVAS
jgi:aspartate 1-decarboxylase